MPALKENPDGTPHIHEFIRHKSTSGRPTSTYTCAHPSCFTSFHKAKLKGKESLCSVCHKTKIILDREQLRRASPRCLECSNTAEAQSIKKNREILREMGIV